jgi:hypothetical protein
VVERNGQTPRVSVPLDPEDEGVTWWDAEDVEDDLEELPEFFVGPGGVGWILCWHTEYGAYVYLREE